MGGRVVAELLVKIGADNSDAKNKLKETDSFIGASVAKQKVASAGMLAMGGAIVAGLTVAIKSAASFEQGMSGVQAAITGLDSSQMAKLSDEALRIGETTTQSATGAAAAMEILGKAGLSYEQILGGAAQAAVNLAEATGEALPQAAETFAAMTNLYEGQGLSASRMADITTQAMNQSSASLSELQTGHIRLAPVVAATGMSYEEASAQLAYWNSLGVPAAEVGTSLTRIFTDLTQPIDGTGQALADMGIEVYDLQGKFVGYPAIFKQLEVATAGMTDEQRNNALALLFSADSLDLVNIGLNNNLEGYDAVRASMDKQGVAAEASRIRLNNLAGDIENLKGVLESAAISIGKAFILPLRTLVKALVGLVAGFNKLPQPIKQILALAAGVGAAILLLAGTFGLAAAAGAPLTAGFGVMAAAIGLLFSPIMLIVGGLVLLGAMFSGDILDGIVELGDRFSEFIDDVTDVYDRLRSGKDVLDATTRQYTHIASSVSVLSALLRAFGSALEDLTGIEMSDWWFNLGQAVDAFVDAVGDRDIVGMITSLFDIGELVFDATISVGRLLWGGIKEGVGDLWTWIKGKIMGVGGAGTDASSVASQQLMGASQGDMRQEITWQTVVVTVGALLWGGIKQGIGNLWDWIKQHIVSGNPGGYGGTRGDSVDNGPAAAQDITWESVVVKVGSLIWGGITALGGALNSLWEWVKAKIMGGGAGGDAASTASQQLLGNASAGQAQDITLGDVVVKIAGLVWGGITALGGALGGVWEWVKAQIMGGGGDAASTASRQLLGDSGGSQDITLGQVVVKITKIVADIAQDAYDELPPKVQTGMDAALAAEPVQVSPKVEAKVEDTSADWTILGVMYGVSILAGFGEGIASTDWGSASTYIASAMGSIPVAFAVYFAFVLGPAVFKIAAAAFRGIFDGLATIWNGLGLPTFSNPFEGLGETVGGWIEGATRTILLGASQLKVAWGSFWDDVRGAAGGGGTAGADMATSVSQQLLGQGMSGAPIDVEVDMNLIPVVSGHYQDDVQAAINNELAESSVTVAVPVNVQLETALVTGTGMLNNAADIDPSLMGGDSLGLMVQKVMITADTTDLDTKVGTAKESLAGMVEQPYEALLDAEYSGVTDAYNVAMATGGNWASQVFTAKLDSDYTGTTNAYNAAMATGGNWASQVFTAIVSADHSQALFAVNQSFEAGNSFNGSVFTGYITMDTSGLDNALFHARWVAGEIAAILPHSPAKKGPLRHLPSFAYIGEIARKDFRGLGAILADAMDPGSGRPFTMGRYNINSQMGVRGGEAGAGGGDTVVYQQNTYKLDRPTFQSGTDWKGYFDKQNREAAVAAFEG